MKRLMLFARATYPGRSQQLRVAHAARVLFACAANRTSRRHVEAGARKKFEAADAELNKVYKADIAGLDQAGAAKLREAERDWIAYRDSDDRRRLTISGTNSFRRPETHRGLLGVHGRFHAKDRIEFLRAYAGKNTAAGTGGKYSDSYGGELELKETKEGIEFSLSVVRGNAHNEGSLDGTLHREGDKAHFKQKLKPTDGQDGPPCELVFTFIGNHIVKIEEKTPDSQAGNNVHYDGEYYKIGNLKKPDAAPAATPGAVTPQANATAATPAPTEKPTVEQARKTFEATDNLLTAAYKEAGAGLDAAKMSELRQKERDWITYREMLAKSAPYFNGGAQSDSPKGTVDYWQTMNEITRARVDFLRAWSGKKLPAGITGVYSDSYGGTLELEEKKSGLAFSDQDGARDGAQFGEHRRDRAAHGGQGGVPGPAGRGGRPACVRDHVHVHRGAHREGGGKERRFLPRVQCEFRRGVLQNRKAGEKPVKLE